MVDRTKSKFTILQNEILKELFKKSGKKVNQRRLAVALGVSQTAVMKALPKLKESNFIRINKDKETKRWAIEINKDNSRVMHLKRADNLKQIYESGLADFLEKEFMGTTIILFGSYSRGDDTINSDIDIAIIGAKNKELNLKTFEKKLERKIHINFYEKFSRIHKYLKENLANGIIIAGGFEL